MKNKKLAFGIVMMTVGIAVSAASIGATGTSLMAVGVVFFISGMWEVRKEKEKIK